jgi:hypothetical protein
MTMSHNILHSGLCSARSARLPQTGDQLVVVLWGFLLCGKKRKDDLEIISCYQNNSKKGERCGKPT